MSTDRIEKLTVRATDLMRQAWNERQQRDPTPEKIRGEIYARAIFTALQEERATVEAVHAAPPVPSCDPGRKVELNRAAPPPAYKAPAPLAVRWEQDGPMITLVGLPDGLSAAVYPPGVEEPGVKWRWCLAGENARIIASDKYPGVETQKIAQDQLLDALGVYLVERVSTCMRTLDALQPERLQAPLPEVPEVPDHLRAPRQGFYKVGVRLVFAAESVEGVAPSGTAALAEARAALSKCLSGRQLRVTAVHGGVGAFLPVTLESERYFIESIDGKPVEE